MEPGELAPVSGRYRIAREGVTTWDGRMLGHGSLEWEDEPLPLMMMPEGEKVQDGHDGSLLLGTVTAVRREEAGWLTAVLSEVRPGLAPEIDCSDIQEEHDGDVPVIRHARLRGVTLGRHPAWHGLVIL